VRWASRQVAAVVTVLASLFGAAACVNVPTSGPIEKVEGQQARNQNYVNVEVVPPAPGAKGKQIVEGFLRANNSYQPNYLVAKQFLTRSAAEKWTPEAGASIYTGSPKDEGNTVTLDGWLVGSLGPDRTYTTKDRQLDHDFGLVKEDGEWRISKPLEELMIANFYFNSFYRTYDRYFVGKGTSRSLVPDPIYLPALTNPANVASALIKGLLTGPSEWLKPAVSNAIPPNTSLSVDSVTITDGIAEVPLSDSVLDLPDQQRSLMAAQIAYTLRQVGGIKGVVIKVNQQPYRVPGSDPNSLAISVDAIPRDLEPVPFVAGDQLYAIQGNAVKQVTTDTNPPGVNDVAGALGRSEQAVDALAVSLTNTDFAATMNGGTTLLRSPIVDGDPITLLDRDQGVSELLRPQFTRYNEIWTIGRQGGRQRIWIFTADPSATPNEPSEIRMQVIDSPELRNVKAFKISLDGTRIALVRDLEFDVKSELVLARIIRSDEIGVNGWHPVDTTQTNNNTPQIQKIADVAWRDATELLVLGAAPADTALAPYLVVQDGSTITPHGEPGNRDGRELAVLPGRQTAIILDRDGRLWREDGSQLPIEADKVSAIAYPG
jgi:Lipoprotein LpqB beta-propeller domain/Sporulation and spore germination